MGIVKEDLGLISGGGINSLIEKYKPSANDANILGNPYAVEAGKTYIAIAQGGNGSATNVYQVAGGDIISQDVSNYCVWGSSNQVHTIIIVFKATASSVTISLQSGGYATGLFGGIIAEVG